MTNAYPVTLDGRYFVVRDYPGLHIALLARTCTTGQLTKTRVRLRCTHRPESLAPQLGPA